MMCNPASLFLQHATRFTMEVIHNNYGLVMRILIVSTMASTIYVLYLFAHLSTEVRDYGTMLAMEHCPFTMPLLLLCTHVILAFLARKMYIGFKQNIGPLAPALFVFFVGKLWMLVRLCMAYSSDNLGDVLEFFLLEESMLIVVQVATTSLIFPRLGLSYTCMNTRGQERVCKAVIILDAVKTLGVYVLRKNHESGGLSRIFNRIPGFRDKCSPSYTYTFSWTLYSRPLQPSLCTSPICAAWRMRNHLRLDPKVSY